MPRRLFFGAVLLGTFGLSLTGAAQVGEQPAKDDKGEKASRQEPEAIRMFDVEPDREFDDELDPARFELALNTADVPRLTAWVVRLLELEKKLGRPRKDVKSGQLLDTVATIAGRLKDGESLKILAVAAAGQPDKTLSAKVTTLAELASKSRAPVKPVTVDLDGTSTEAFTTAKYVLESVERAKLNGSRTDLQNLSGFIDIAKSSEMLPATLAEWLQGRVKQAVNEVPEDNPDPILARLTLGSRAPAKGPQQPLGPKFDKVKTFAFGSQQVRLIADKVSGYDFTEKGMETAAKDLYRKHKNDYTHVWDDKWYRQNLKDRVGEYWVLVIDNTTNTKGRSYAYAAIRNTPSAWVVRFHEQKDSVIVPDGQKVTKRYDFNGYKVDLDFNNPAAKQGYPSDEFWYSFGF